jgi:hypothetical protein
MKAAISSCRAWMKVILSSARRMAPKTPPPHGAKDAIDAVARVTVDAPHSPLVQTLDNKVTNGSRHDPASLRCGRSSRSRGGTCNRNAAA